MKIADRTPEEEAARRALGVLECSVKIGKGKDLIFDIGLAVQREAARREAGVHLRALVDALDRARQENPLRAAPPADPVVDAKVDRLLAAHEKKPSTPLGPEPADVTARTSALRRDEP